jgi:hypothetical protein
LHEINPDLRALVRFLPALEKPDFEPGEVIESSSHMPYILYSETVSEFIHAADKHGWVRRGFNWPEWARTAEARRLREDGPGLARATKDQLVRLLTTILRQDRFSEGALLHAFESGLMLRIVRRAAALPSENQQQET